MSSIMYDALSHIANGCENPATIAKFAIASSSQPPVDIAEIAKKLGEIQSALSTIAARSSFNLSMEVSQQVGRLGIVQSMLHQI